MSRPFNLITFDFDGVLLHNDFPDLFLETCRELGLTWKAENEKKLLRFIHYYFSEPIQKDQAQYGQPAAWIKAHERFLAALGAEGDVENARLQLAKIRSHHLLSFHEAGIHELLETLRQQDYRLAMLTNRSDSVHDFGAEWGFIEPFEFIATRDTVSKRKPAPDVFHYLNDRFGISPTRCLHIGDNPYTDALGAQNAGWNCLLIDPDELFPDWDIPRLPSIRDLLGWLETESRRRA